MTEKEIMDKIEAAEKWLSAAGYNAYNTDIAFESVRQIVKRVIPRPCEDAVSRKAVLNLAKDLDFTSVKGLEYYKHRCIEIGDVEDLPPVKPDLSSLREMNSILIKRVAFLENSTWCAVGPKQPVKYVDKGCEDRIEMYPVCPNCKEEILNHKWIFCPYCGTPLKWNEED